MRRLLSAGLFVACVASVGRAQDTTALIAGDAAASAELSKIIEATRANGLPIDPILAKIRQAVLFAHTPAPRIVAVARAMSARLEEARAALAPNPTQLDIAAGGDALGHKVSAQSLKDIRRVSGNRPVAVPLGVLTQLVTNQVDEKKATKIVADLIRNGANSDMLVAYGNQVSSDVQSGTKPNNAADLRNMGLSAVLGVPGAAAAANVGDALTSAGAPTPPPGKKKP